MKKRYLAVLTLALLLVFTAIPNLAIAGGVNAITTYDELVARISGLQPENSLQIIVEPAEDFGWPEQATLTLARNIGLDVKAPWEIPAGITVDFQNGAGGIRCPELTINGNINTTYSSQDFLFGRCDKVIIGPTGTFSSANDQVGQSTFCGQRIYPETVWEVQEGADLNCRIRLGGTLTGEGSVSGRVDVSGGFTNNLSEHGTISGNLTIVGGVSVGHDVIFDGDTIYDDTLDIPAGSHITLGGNLNMIISNATVNLSGVLEAKEAVDGDYYGNNRILFNQGGKLCFLAGSQLILNNPCGIGEYVRPQDFQLTEETRGQLPHLMEGRGVILCRADSAQEAKNWGLLYQLIDKVIDDSQTPDKLSFANCYIDFHNIRIERNWAAAPLDSTYTISFDAVGGTLVGDARLQVTKDEAVKMPNAIRSGYTLKHWQNKANSSQIYGLDGTYKFSADTNLIAVWEYIGGSSGGGGGSSRPATKPGTSTETKPGTDKPSTGSDSKEITAANIATVFGDVQNNAWYSEAIAYVYNNGMMNGTEKGFEPNAATTRAMIVTMLHRLNGTPAAGAAGFADVAGGQWYSEAVAWAAANGVVNGYSDTKFAPNEEISREQLAAILYRYAQFKGLDVSAKGDLSGFADAGQVSGWAKEAMQWAVGAGLLNGNADGSLAPAAGATRAEVAMILMRFESQIK